MGLRLFVAIELPDEWTDALASMQVELERKGLERLRWVRSEGIHLTLKFLGEVDEAALAGVTGAVRRAAAHAAPFSLTLGRSGVFGPPSRPRVLWTGVGGNTGALDHLWRTVEEEMNGLGFPSERRGFSPHLTLARIPDRPAAGLASAILAGVGAMAPPAVAPMTVTHLAVMQSKTGPEGARYTRRESARLSQTSEPGIPEC